MGVSKSHRNVTAVRTDPTATKDTTLSYEAPEAEFEQDKPRSHLYDIRSMGCMFLEFAVWLLYSLDAVDSFFHRRRKESRSDPTAAQGNFYRRGDSGAPEVHAKVFQAVDTLCGDPRCRGGTALQDFVQLIRERLLLVNVERRARAQNLYVELGKVVRKAENPPHLLNKVDSPPDIPAFFRRGGSRQNSDSSASNPDAGQPVQAAASLENRPNGAGESAAA